MTATAIRNPVSEAPDEIVRIRSAFELFDNQSKLLRDSFENLKQNLAETNKELNRKNRALSGKVEELRQMSSRLHCILESIADGVLVVNTNLSVERCNLAAESLLEMPRTNIEDHDYTDIMNGLGNLEKLKLALEQGCTVFDEQRSTVDAKGRRIHVLASVSPIRSAGGAILGAVEVLRDVTRQRVLEERVHHQKRMVALGEMATSVAHEIRNPLGTIEGFARLLKQDLDLAGQPEHSRLSSKIIEGAQNLNYVITNLLTYARPMTLQYEPFSARTLLDSTEDVLVGHAEEKCVRLEVNRPDKAVQLNGDIRQLRQVLINLGRNAVEACADGGHVAINATSRKRDVLITISDNGCGIPQEHLSKIFDPFFTSKEGGTGLGLSLCHKIVSAHGGEIMVNSKPGVGTIIKVVLPHIGGDV